MKFRPLRGSWILICMFIMSVCVPYFPGLASAADSGKIIFGWQQAQISQILTNVNVAGKTSITLKVSAAEFQDWKTSTDELNIGIELLGSGGGLIYQHSTGINYIDTTTFSDYTLTIDAADVSAWDQVASIKAFIIGKDGEFWAGNYGTQIESASLKFNDGIELLTNVEFTSDYSGWTSDIGWQVCSGGGGGLPCVAAAPAPTSIVVTSLADTTDQGTLRWAITQANATAGGIYDSISFASGLTGTITLTSALPAISQSLVITGPGQSIITIDGNAAYRPFMVNQSVSLGISNITLKKGQNTNGGLIYNNKGTITASAVRFTNMSGGSAVFNNNGGAVATYTDCIFDGLSIGIAGDYGSTPTLPAGTTTWEGYADANFQNRTYVIRGTFNNNWAAIYNYRFTKVENSTFSNNSYGANVTGLNRTQIYNSTFTSNTVGIYHNSWIPSTFNMGTDNRLIDGNTFTGNGTAIYLDDAYNDGHRYQGWSTVKNNIWDQSGVWIQYNFWNGTANESATATPFSTGTQFTQSLNTVPTTTTTTTTTTIPPTTTTQVPTTTTTIPEITTTVAPVFVNPFVTTTTVVGPTIPTTTTIPETTTTTSTTTTTVPPTTTTTTTTTIPPVEEKIPVPSVSEIEKIETKEELQKLVETVDLKNIDAEQSVALISNEAFMELPTEQLAEVFDSIPVDELTTEQEAQLVETLTVAPDEVKNTFEESVDVYASGLDDYVAVDSVIDVGTRRSLIAATTVLSTVAVAPAVGGGSGSGGGGSRGSGGGSGGPGGGPGGSGDGGSSGKKDDEPEEEEEESAEIEGPEGDEEEGNFTKNSIFKYEEGTMKRRFSPWGFIKKFSKETAAMAFTISGSVVVFATLSGETRKITLIATSVAFVVHYINAMLQNDEE